MTDLNGITMPVEHRLLIAFTDITGFTKEFDSLSDRELFDRMAEFYEWIGEETERSGGKIIKFIGDAVLLVYPENEAKQGVEALRLLKTEADGWLRNHHFQGQLLIRAHIGRVVCGPLGIRGDRRFDIIGKAVNATAQLRCDGIAISPELEQFLAAKG